MSKFKNRPITVEAQQYHPFTDIDGVIEVWKVEYEGTGSPTNTVLKAYIKVGMEKVDLKAGDWVVWERDQIKVYPDGMFKLLFDKLK